MKSISYSGETFYLWEHAPNWERPVGTEFSIPSQLQVGLSDREERSPKGEAIRVPSFDFECWVEGDELVDLRDALLAMTNERVAMPFWPAARLQTEYDDTPIPGGLKITFELGDGNQPDFSTYEIHTARAPSGGYTITGNTYTAPLLFGWFSTDLDPEMDSDEFAQFRVSFEEDSEVSHALSIDSQSFTDGPAVGGITPKVFPSRHNWESPASAGGAFIEKIQRRKIGQGRRQSVEFHDADAKRRVIIDCLVTSLTDVAKLVRFFQDRKGITESFWLPGQLADTRLAANVDSTDTTIEVVDGTVFTNHDYLALIDADNVIAREITSIDGNTLTLGSAVGADIIASRSSLCALLLVRFEKRRLRLRWDTGGIGSVQVECLELRPEYSIPSDETLNDTLGALPVEASLYEFTVGGTVVARHTSYEQDLTYDSESWTAKNITHGNITRTATLDDKVSIEADTGVDVLEELWSGQKADVFLRILKVEVSSSNGSNGRVVFSGEIDDVTSQGIKLTADCVAIGRDFDTPVPRGYFQQPCNYGLFSTGCGLDKDDWTFSAVVVSKTSSTVYVLDTFDRVNEEALPGGFGFADWFAFGTWLTGNKRTIIKSTAINSGEITITIDEALDTDLEVDDEVRLLPGCNGQASSCKAYHASNNPKGKFDNYDDWGGHWIAPGNLSLLKVSPTAGGGKK